MKMLRVPGTFDSLSAIRDYVRRAAALAGLDDGRSYRLQLAVDELATNIVEHAYGPSAGSGDIFVHAEIDGAHLRVTIEDTAPAFDPTQHARPADLASPLEGRSLGGLGIYLAMLNVDEFRYEYVDRRNRSILLVALPTSSGTAP